MLVLQALVSLQRVFAAAGFAAAGFAAAGFAEAGFEFEVIAAAGLVFGVIPCKGFCT